MISERAPVDLAEAFFPDSTSPATTGSAWPMSLEPPSNGTLDALAWARGPFDCLLTPEVPHPGRVDPDHHSPPPAPISLGFAEIIVRHSGFPSDRYLAVDH